MRLLLVGREGGGGGGVGRCSGACGGGCGGAAAGVASDARAAVFSVYVCPATLCIVWESSYNNDGGRTFARYEPHVEIELHVISTIPKPKIRTSRKRKAPCVPLSASARHRNSSHDTCGGDPGPKPDTGMGACTIRVLKQWPPSGVL